MPNNLFHGQPANEERLARSEKRWGAALFVSAVTGISAGLLGLTLGALSLIGISDIEPHMGHLGTWLVGAFIPLMLFAAHALDKAQEAKKAARLEYCKKHGLKL